MQDAQWRADEWQARTDDDMKGTGAMIAAPPGTGCSTGHREVGEGR